VLHGGFDKCAAQPVVAPAGRDENVLVPYRAEENENLFRRNGFEIVEPFFRWYNFSGFLCVKKPALK
jgi:hypothetical protein